MRRAGHRARRSSKRKIPLPVLSSIHSVGEPRQDFSNCAERQHGRAGRTSPALAKFFYQLIPVATAWRRCRRRCAVDAADHARVIRAVVIPSGSQLHRCARCAWRDVTDDGSVVHHDAMQVGSVVLPDERGAGGGLNRVRVKCLISGRADDVNHDRVGRRARCGRRRFVASAAPHRDSGRDNQSCQHM